MNRPPSRYETERMFLRSCLESAPLGGVLRSFNTGGATRKFSPTRLHVLKQTLLQEALAQTTDPQIQKQLCGAANVAAELVWDTNSPLLLFPCLFAEKMAAIFSLIDQDGSASQPADFTFELEPGGQENGGLHPGDPWFHPIAIDEDAAVALNALEA